MSKRKIILLLCLSVSAILLPLLGGRWFTREPVYHGKKLSGWLADCSYWMSVDDPRAPQKILAAQEAVRQIGGNGIPVLLNKLEKKDSRFKGRVARFVESRTRQFFPAWHGYEMRSQAVWAFTVLGARAAPAIPSLTRMLLDTNRLDDFGIQTDVSMALAAIGPESLESLIAGIRHPHKAVRYGAFQGMEYLGSVYHHTNRTPAAMAARACLANQAVPVLTQLIEAKDVLRVQAAGVLGQLSLRPELSIPALTNLYQDMASNHFGRRSVVEALGNFGPEARIARPLLASATGDPDATVRNAAEHALKAVGGP